ARLAAGDPERLVSGAVVVVEGKDAASPGGRPVVLREQRLEAGRQVRRGGDGTVVNEGGEVRIVRHRAAGGEPEGVRSAAAVRHDRPPRRVPASAAWRSRVAFWRHRRYWAAPATRHPWRHSGP